MLFGSIAVIVGALAGRTAEKNKAKIKSFVKCESPKVEKDLHEAEMVAEMVAEVAEVMGSTA